MERKTIALGKETGLKIALIPGDLRLTGWDENEIKAKTNGNLLELTSDGELVTLNCDNDLILSVPKHIEIEIDDIAGDASLRVLDGSLKLGQVGGDLALRNVGVIDLGELAGDLVVRHTSASLKVEHVSGDASVRDVDGAINFADIGGDLHLRNPQDNLKAVVAGDVIASISPQPDAAYQIDAGADIVLRLPVEADV